MRRPEYLRYPQSLLTESTTPPTSPPWPIMPRQHVGWAPHPCLILCRSPPQVLLVRGRVLDRAPIALRQGKWRKCRILSLSPLEKAKNSHGRGRHRSSVPRRLQVL